MKQASEVLFMLSSLLLFSLKQQKLSYRVQKRSEIYAYVK